MIFPTTKLFRKLLADLPPHIQNQALESFRVWMRDPWHASLQFKQIHASRFSRCILAVLCWPAALLALILFPLVWLLALPLRLVGAVLRALMGTLLLAPARLLHL